MALLLEGYLEPAHFNFQPQDCSLLIPVILEDPTGFKYAHTFGWNISDIFMAYSEKLNKQLELKKDDFLQQKIKEEMIKDLTREIENLE